MTAGEPELRPVVPPVPVKAELRETTGLVLFFATLSRVPDFGGDFDRFERFSSGDSVPLPSLPRLVPLVVAEVSLLTADA